MTLAATRMAVADAGIRPEDLRGPRTAVVMIDAEAFEIAHPTPGGVANRTSAIVSPSMRTHTVTASPHIGLWPDPSAEAPSRAPKFRGDRL